MENCLRCGLPEDSEKHNNRAMGWHPFRGQEYLNGLEDALLFAREAEQEHQWEETGIQVDTIASFPEKRCSVCGCINWGGEEGGICFGNNFAEQGIIAAHNRRALEKRMTRLASD